MLVYLRYDGHSVSVASDEDYERPVIWMHEDTCCLSTGGVKRSGTTPMGALDITALHLPLYSLPAVCTFLAKYQRQEWRGSKGYMKQDKGISDVEKLGKKSQQDVCY